MWVKYAIYLSVWDVSAWVEGRLTNREGDIFASRKRGRVGRYRGWGIQGENMCFWLGGGLQACLLVNNRIGGYLKATELERLLGF